MRRMNPMEAVVSVLEDEGVRVAFGIPGAAILPLYAALADSIPIICITGQANRDVLHKEAFQAVDIVEIARPVCKWAYQVKETAQLPWAFREAFRVAREGRPGPVLIDLPLDVQTGPDIAYDAAADHALPHVPPTPHPGAIAAAL